MRIRAQSRQGLVEEARRLPLSPTTPSPECESLIWDKDQRSPSARTPTHLRTLCLT